MQQLAVPREKALIPFQQQTPKQTKHVLQHFFFLWVTSTKSSHRYKFFNSITWVLVIHSTISSYCTLPRRMAVRKRKIIYTFLEEKQDINGALKVHNSQMQRKFTIAILVSALQPIFLRQSFVLQVNINTYSPTPTTVAIHRWPPCHRKHGHFCSYLLQVFLLSGYLDLEYSDAVPGNTHAH